MSKDLLRPAFSFSAKQVAESTDSSEKLVVELGQYHIAYAVVRSDVDEVLEFKLFSTEEKISAAAFTACWRAYLLSRHFETVIVVHHSNKVALIPTSFFRQEDALAIIKLLYGDADKLHISHAEQPALSIVSVYGTDAELFEEIATHFPDAAHVHINHLLLKLATPLIASATKDCFKVFFYPSNLILMVVIAGKLQLLQQYFYAATDDVSYRLLNVCAQIGLDPHTISLSISGAISADAAILYELKKLFQEVAFDALNSPFPPDATLEVPSYFFTPSLLALTCV